MTTKLFGDQKIPNNSKLPFNYLNLRVEKHVLAGKKLGLVLYYKRCNTYDIEYSPLWPDLALKTWPKQLKGSIPLDISLPD